ncbi:hypothetical protein KR018_011099, partial [Drosophila ironensis]
QVMHHSDFINQIRKTLYYGVDAVETDMEVSLPFAEYAAEIFSEPHRGHSLHRLSCVAAGKIPATPCSLIMALIYLDRLNVIDPGYGCRITPQELFVVSLMISTKFYAGHDERFYLEDWAKEGSMTEGKLKKMELDFLSAIDWNIYISNEHFFEKLSSVERALAEREGLRRGWLTYSELIQLLPSLSWMKFLLNSMSILTLCYAASVITLAGAFLIASYVPGTLWHRKASITSVTSTNTTKIFPPASLWKNDALNRDIFDLSSSQSCFALNVDAKFLKLENNYCDTRRYDAADLRLFTQSASKLPQKNNLQWKEIRLTHEVSPKLLNLKFKYSEDEKNWLTYQHTHLESRLNQSKNASYLWQLLSNAMK